MLICWDLSLHTIFFWGWVSIGSFQAPSTIFNRSSGAISYKSLCNGTTCLASKQQVECNFHLQKGWNRSKDKRFETLFNGMMELSEGGRGNSSETLGGWS